MQHTAQTQRGHVNRLLRISANHKAAFKLRTPLFQVLTICSALAAAARAKQPERIRRNLEALRVERAASLSAVDLAATSRGKPRQFIDVCST